jgi:hypothetical protein
MYMDVAQSRLEYQKTMARILIMVQDQLKDGKLQKEIASHAYAAEEEAKCEMAALEAETSEPDLNYYADLSESHGSSTNLDY